MYFKCFYLSTMLQNLHSERLKPLSLISLLKIMEIVLRKECKYLIFVLMGKKFLFSRLH